MSAVGPNLPLARLQNYNGKSDSVEFLTRFEETSRSRGWDQAHWARIVVQFLDGDALELYRALSQDQRDDWQRLKHSLNNVFASVPSATLTATDLKQGSDSVSVYAVKLHRAMRHDFPVCESFSVEAQQFVMLKLFLNGLEPTIRFQLGVPSFPVTFPSALTSAKRVEALLLETRELQQGLAAVLEADAADERGEGPSHGPAKHQRRRRRRR